MGGNFPSRLLRPVHYSCYEMGHTWTPSCTDSATEVGLTCFEEGLKIYSSVYAASAAFKGRLPTADEAVQLLFNILQSSAFLAYNAFGYVACLCVLREMLGFLNFYTLGWLPSVIASFCSIFVERPSRRAPLAVYVGNVATESLLSSYGSTGLLPALPMGETILFSVLAAVVLRMYKTLNVGGGKSGERRDVLFSFIRYLIGKEEILPPTSSRSFAKHDSVIATASFSARLILRRAFSTAIGIVPNDGRAEVCPHLGSSCLAYAVKGFAAPFTSGALLQFALLALRRKTPLARQLLSLDNYRLGLFMGSFGAIFKLCSCFLRGTFGVDHPDFALPAGALAGLSMGVYRSKSLAIYTLWKTMEVLCVSGASRGILPRVPLFTEVVYALCTSVLFHLGVCEPHSLKPSYFAFMNRITADRFVEFNRVLIDHEYGTQAAIGCRHVPTFRQDLISQKLKDILHLL